MPNRRHARRTHRDAAKLAAAGNHQGALAIYAHAEGEFRGCLAVHPEDRATRSDFAELLADLAASHAVVGEVVEAYAAQRERVAITTSLEAGSAERAAARLDLAEAAVRAGRFLTAATEADAALSLLDDVDPADSGSPGFLILADAIARTALVLYRAADPDLAVGAADQAARMLVAAGPGPNGTALLRDSLRLAAALHSAAGRTAHARGASDLLVKHCPDAEPVTAPAPLTLRGALQAAAQMGAFLDTGLIDRLCPDPGGRDAPPTVSDRCDLGLAAVALHAAEPAVDALAPTHPNLAWRIATEVHYLLTAADRQGERNLHLNFRDHGPVWLAMLMALAGTGKQGPIMHDLATALAELCERLHTRHAAGFHEPRFAAATRFIQAYRDPAARLLLGAEPAGDVEAEEFAGGHGAQVGVEGGEAVLADGLGPAGLDGVEQARGPVEDVDASAGEADDLAAGVAGVGGAFDVALAFEARDGLAGGLLGDAEAGGELDGGGAADADGLEDEAVHGPDAGVALAGELLVDFVDDAAEGREEPQWQLVSGGFTCHDRQPDLLYG
jgi:tetratricopeptide (TPR) repeat protein